MHLPKHLCLNQNCTNGKNTIRPIIEQQQGKCGYCRCPLDTVIERRGEVIELSQQRVSFQRSFVM